MSMFVYAWIPQKVIFYFSYFEIIWIKLFLELQSDLAVFVHKKWKLSCFNFKFDLGVFVHKK